MRRGPDDNITIPASPLMPPHCSGLPLPDLVTSLPDPSLSLTGTPLPLPHHHDSPNIPPHADPPLHHHIQGLFAFTSWNTNALLAALSTSGDAKHARSRAFHSILDKEGIHLFQETHGSEADLDALQTSANRHLLKGSFCDTANTGGILFAIPRDVAAEFALHIVVPGRIAYLLGTLHGLTTMIINIHLVPNLRLPEARRQLTALAREVRRHRSATVFLLGDMNFVDPDEGRLQVSTGSITHRREEYHRLFTQLFPRFVEFAQPDYTRCRYDQANDLPRTLSRLDRCFSNIPTMALHDTNVSCSTLWPAIEMRNGSDHCPISLRICPRRPPEGFRMARWISSHPAFGKTVTADLMDTNFPADPIQARDVLKDILRGAYHTTRHLLSAAIATELSEKLHWTTCALRAAYLRDYCALQVVCARWPPLAHSLRTLGNGDAFVSRISEIACSLSSKIVDDDIAQLEADSRDMADEQHSDMVEDRRRQLSRLRARKERWFKTRRRIILEEVCHPDGSPASCDEDAVHLLREHWSSAAEAHDSDPSRYQHWAQYVQKGTVESWTISKEDFAAILSRRKHSSPGPDGIPFSALAAAGSAGIDILYNLYIHCHHHGHCPEDFKTSLTAFIPKGADSVLAATPDSLRPIALSNTDAKLIISAQCAPLERLSRTTLHQAQACARGRQMVENLWHLERHAVLQKIDSDVPHLAATFLTDFAAAFPSLSHRWIAFVLKQMTIPTQLVTFLTTLYTGGSTNICYRGRRYTGFGVHRGVRQGCPASMLLFNLCLDPVVRWMHARVLGPLDTLRLYADDFGFGLHNYVVSLPRLERAFREVEKGIGLALKIPKCALIPNSEKALGPAAAHLRCIPFWHGCPVVLAARYLGAYIGPSAPRIAWDRPLAACRRIALQLRAENLGFVRTAVAFNQRAAPTLSFTAQLFIPSRRITGRYTAIAQTIAAMPHNTFTGNILYHGRKLGLGVDIAPLDLVSRAARFRLSQSSDACSLYHDLVQHCYGDGLGLARLPAWQQLHIHSLSLHAVASAAGDTTLQGLFTTSPTKIQAAALRCLRRAQPIAEIHEYVASRIGRWLGPTSAIQIRSTARRVTAVANAAGPFLAVSVWRTLLRGWCTAQRFGSPPSGCPFGCGDADTMMHMIACPRIWSAAFHAEFCSDYGIPFSPLPRIRELCLLDDRPANFGPERDLLCAVLIDAVFFAFNKKRHGRSSLPVRLIRSRIAELSRRSARLRCLLAAHTPRG